MNDLEKLVKAFEVAAAKASVERMVLKQIVTTLISRHAKEYENPEEYIMTLTAASVIGFDETPPEDDLGKMAFEHAVSYCNDLETTALALVRDD